MGEWRRRMFAAGLALVLGCGSAVRAQDPASVGGDLKQEALAADTLYQAQNLVGAAPLYEDLHKREPANLTWTERLAMSLLGVTATQEGAQAAATRDRAHSLLLEAKAAGDNSALIQIVLEKMDANVAAAPKGPESPGMDAFRRAEKAFSSGDLNGALKLYGEAAAADPKMYEAPLYAGDTEYKLGHFPEAGVWYGKAVAVNPNRETAYRYWGDSLRKQGDQKEAENKFIEAVLSEPYSKATRLGLKQWADGNHAQIIGPPVILPAPAVPDAKGNTNINIDPKTPAPVMSAVMAYQIGSTVWRRGEFAKTYPAEKQYRHSLAEEAQSIRTALSTLKSVPRDKLDATWKTLLDLDKDGMLESWILLDHADQGIAQDYLAYRAAHRETMHAYIAKYDVHVE